MNELIKNKTAFKSFLLSLVAALTLSVILPGFTTKASANPINLTKNDLYSNEEVVTEQDLFEESLQANPNFLIELERAKFSYQMEINKQPKDEISTAGVITAPLKALKALGVTVKHGGTALSWLLKPFSKKYSVLIKKHSRHISNVLAKPENNTKAYIQAQLVKAGVPKSDAVTIVYWIFMVL